MEAYINLAITGLYAVSVVWVYLDATKNKIGKIPKSKSIFFNNSAGGWATLTLLLWIIGFPAYLFKRKALIEKAQEQPIEVKGRGVKTGIFAILSGGLFLVTALGTISLSSPVEMVKNSTMDGYDKTTILQAFEFAFDYPNWSSFETEKGETVVEFKGGISSALHDQVTKPEGFEERVQIGFKACGRFLAEKETNSDVDFFAQLAQQMSREENQLLMLILTQGTAKGVPIEESFSKVCQLYKRSIPSSFKLIAKEAMDSYIKIGSPVSFQWTLSADGESFELTHIDLESWNGLSGEEILDEIYK